MTDGSVRPLRCRVNGIECETLPAYDRGVCLGDGVFETVRIWNGRVTLWAGHEARLMEGLRRLQMDPGASTMEALRQEVNEAAREVETGVLRVTLTRGTGAPGYAVPPKVCFTRIITLWEARPPEPSIYSDGVRVRRCALRLAVQPALAGIKHLNRLEQVLARAEWSDAEVAEGLLADSEGRLVEGTMSNVFLQLDGALVTPDLSRCGVRGTMRDYLVQQFAASGTPVREIDVPFGRISAAEELFLCNSVMGVWPVREVDGDRFPVGPLARQAMAMAREVIGVPGSLP